MFLLIKNPINTGYLLAQYDISINLLRLTINGLEVLARSEEELKENIKKLILKY